MTLVRGIPWPRIIAEGTIIVVSILLAFWIDAWWSDNQTRKAEIEYLIGLHDDFSATQKVIADQISYIENRFRSVDDVLRVLADTDLQQLPQDFPEMVGDVYGITTTTKSTATYQDLVNSGNLRIIRSKSLRLAMAELVELLRDFDSREQLTLASYWRNHAPFVNLHMVSSEFGWFRSETSDVGKERARLFGETPNHQFEMSEDAVRSKQFWNLMYDWKVMYADQLEPLLLARARCETVLAMLSSELDTVRVQ